ncbi:DUF202 domain-containing protein [Streptomyces sp. NPDC001312]|uniref:DUF202 domain-containing protein n=1 Tax=Streptomyces sp. NPDC001312 TaxID=3364561 RepID=UPI00368CF11F
MSGSERSPRPTVAEDLEDLDPGLARERTWLAWRRTAISLTAVSAAVLKISPIDGALLLVMALAVWATGRGHVATGSRLERYKRTASRSTPHRVDHRAHRFGRPHRGLVIVLSDPNTSVSPEAAFSSGRRSGYDWWPA